MCGCASLPQRVQHTSRLCAYACCVPVSLERRAPLSSSLGNPKACADSTCLRGVVPHLERRLPVAVGACRSAFSGKGPPHGAVVPRPRSWSCALVTALHPDSPDDPGVLGRIEAVEHPDVVEIGDRRSSRAGAQLQFLAQLAHGRTPAQLRPGKIVPPTRAFARARGGSSRRAPAHREYGP